MQIGELMNIVQLKNRVIDRAVHLTYDGKHLEFKPGEVVNIARPIAEWLLNKSLYRFNPGDENQDPPIPASYHYKLCILGGSTDESDLTSVDINRKELLDVENMPSLNRVDPTTGKTMRRVYLNPSATGAVDNVTRNERQAQQAVSSAIIKHAAEEIAEAVQSVSDAEIDSAVKDMAGVA